MYFFFFSQDKKASTFSLVEVTLSSKQGEEGSAQLSRVSISQLLSASQEGATSATVR